MRRGSRTLRSRAASKNARAHSAEAAATSASSASAGRPARGAATAYTVSHGPTTPVAKLPRLPGMTRSTCCRSFEKRFCTRPTGVRSNQLVGARSTRASMRSWIARPARQPPRYWSARASVEHAPYAPTSPTYLREILRFLRIRERGARRTSTGSARAATRRSRASRRPTPRGATRTCGDIEAEASRVTRAREALDARASRLSLCRNKGTHRYAHVCVAGASASESTSGVPPSAR